MTGPLLQAEGLFRSFGLTPAVDGISFAVDEGEVLGLVGPNGAGKSTLLALISGSLTPQEGTVRIGDDRVGTRDVSWRGQVGVLSHRSFLYGHLTARENLRFYGSLYGVHDVEGRARELLEAVGLTEHADRRVKEFSRGMTQRLALARTLVHDPRLVLLDEPFTGLDRSAALALEDTVRRLRERGKAIVLVTHHLHEGVLLADSMAIQVRGRFAWHESDFPRDPADFEAIYHRTVAAVS